MDNSNPGTKKTGLLTSCLMFKENVQVSEQSTRTLSRRDGFGTNANIFSVPVPLKITDDHHHVCRPHLSLPMTATSSQLERKKRPPPHITQLSAKQSRLFTLISIGFLNRKMRLPADYIKSKQTSRSNLWCKP